MANILTRHYFTLAELKSMSACLGLTPATTYKTIVTGVVLDGVVVIAGAILKPTAAVSVPVRAANYCLTISSAIGAVDKANLKAVYDGIISRMEKNKFKEVRMTLYSSSKEGFYAATGYPKADGYKNSAGNWILPE